MRGKNRHHAYGCAGVCEIEVVAVEGTPHRNTLGNRAAAEGKHHRAAADKAAEDKLLAAAAAAAAAENHMVEVEQGKDVTLLHMLNQIELHNTKTHHLIVLPKMSNFDGIFNLTYNNNSN